MEHKVQALKFTQHGDTAELLKYRNVPISQQLTQDTSGAM